MGDLQDLSVRLEAPVQRTSRQGAFMRHLVRSKFLRSQDRGRVMEPDAA